MTFSRKTHTHTHIHLYEVKIYIHWYKCCECWKRWKCEGEMNFSKMWYYWRHACVCYLEVICIPKEIYLHKVMKLDALYWRVIFHFPLRFRHYHNYDRTINIYHKCFFMYMIFFGRISMLWNDTIQELLKCSLILDIKCRIPWIQHSENKH